MDWIHLAQDRDQWWAFVSKVVIIRLHGVVFNYAQELREGLLNYVRHTGFKQK
jgi:hypothetical protein